MAWHNPERAFECFESAIFFTISPCYCVQTFKAVLCFDVYNTDINHMQKYINKFTKYRVADSSLFEFSVTHFAYASF